MMETLAPGGRCAVVVPEGALFGSSNAHKSLRQKLVQDFEILAVVSLPAGVFKTLCRRQDLGAGLSQTNFRC